MLLENLSGILVEQKAIVSVYLKREVTVDLYLPRNVSSPEQMSLLLINDGQDLSKMNFSGILEKLNTNGQIQPLLCVGIHAGKERKNEYGTAKNLDFQGRGAKAEAYNLFILKELLPFLHTEYAIQKFKQKAFCGFSLGGLSAIDIVWNYPDVFSISGVFSGSLWWRTKSLEDDYNEDTDRIMHRQIRNGNYKPGLRFYFMTGSLDETADRNGNGVIDSIDDTLDIIGELKKHGYSSETDIRYINFEEGRHDVESWGKAMPGFLTWGWGKNQ
jgi:enterochelin esterase-like enzyme